MAEAKAVVVLWSKASVGSRWVRAEATQAHGNRTLMPVMIEACKRPIMFELTHTVDLSHWKGDANDPAWQSYLAGVRRMVDKGEPKQSAATTPVVPRSGQLNYRLLAILAAVLVIFGIVLWAVNRGTSKQAAPVSAASTVRDSIAVMPFANLTGDPSKDYLGDGMSEELLNVLAKVPGLKVPSRTSSFAYKGRNTDLKQIAKDLQVGTILEGSVRSAGETIRVTAQLIDAQTDRHLWSETYDRKFTDLFQLQDDLAKAIVQALQVNLKGAAPVSVALAPPTQDVEAYRLYLQGWSLYNRSTEPEMLDAIELFKQALTRDPKFARAWSALAETRTIFMVIGYPLPHALEDAEKEATQALALDPSLASASAVLGNINAIRGNWLEAETLFRNAVSRDASDPVIRMDYSSNLLDSVGHLRQGLAERLEAYRLAPADVGAVFILATGYSLMGRDAESLKYADLAIQLGISPDVVPVPLIYANVYARSGRYSEAADRIIITLPPKLRAAGGDEVIKGVYAALKDSAGRPAASASLQSLLRKIKADDLDVNTRKIMIGEFTQLDALDLAFQFANQSLDYFARSGTVASAWGVLWLPEMRPFRRDPRFQAFVTRMGLMDYWNKYGPPDDCDLKDGKLTCH